MRVLVVEGDETIGSQLAEALAAADYAVDVAGDGEEGHFLGDTEEYDAVILDLGLPGLNGISVLERWREAGRSMPVIVLTARDRWSEKVSGIDAGADDYVTKPFQIEEVLARLRAVIRRASGHASAELSCGPLIVDTRRSRVYLADMPITLTAQEYRLLNYLVHHQDRVVYRTELTEHIYNQDFDRDSNTIEVFIGRLRKKIGGGLVHTVRGLGYRMSTEAPAGDDT